MTGPNIFDPDKLAEIRAHGNDWAVVSRDPRTDEEEITIHETMEEAYAARSIQGGDVVELMELDAKIMQQMVDDQDAWQTAQDDQREKDEAQLQAIEEGEEEWWNDRWAEMNRTSH